MKVFSIGRILGAALIVPCAFPAKALPVFNAQTFINNVLIQDSAGSLVAGAEARFGVDAFGNFALATAQSSPTGLFATGASGNHNVTGGLNAKGIATATFDDFVITGPAGPVTTSFNLRLSGNLGVSTLVPAGDRLTQASAAAIVEIRVDGLIVTGDSFFQDRYRLFGQNGVTETQATGMLTNWSPLSGLITTPSFTVDAGEPFTLQISLTAVGGANAFLLDPGLRAEGNSDMSHTLTFAPGTVFNLPDGYSVNSAFAGIVANQFVVPVPAPTGFATLFSAVILLGVRLRARIGNGAILRATAMRGPVIACALN